MPFGNEEGGSIYRIVDTSMQTRDHKASEVLNLIGDLLNLVFFIVCTKIPLNNDLKRNCDPIQCLIHAPYGLLH